MSSFLLRTLLTGAALVLSAPWAQAQATGGIVTVVKVSPLPWFDRMAQGVAAYAASPGALKAQQVGPVRAEAALQAALIEDVLKSSLKAIAIVPTDLAAIEDVARRALDRGVTVVTHEADNQIHTQADLEAFDNPAFGAALHERLAGCMGGQGKWTTFVGTRGSRTHLRWIDGAVANARRHPGMQLVEPLNESNDNAAQAYVRAHELLKRHPDLKGFQGSASSDVIGIGRAVQEAGLTGKVCVVGTGLPERSKALLQAGAIQAIGFWDPRNAGFALNRLAERVAAGEVPRDGMDLGAPGYRRVTVRPGPGKGVIVTGDAAVIVDRRGAAAYPF